MTRKLGIVIEAEDRTLAGSTVEFPYPGKKVPVLDANNVVVDWKPKTGHFTLSPEARTEVSPEVWTTIQAVMAIGPLYPRFRKVGETSTPETQHVGWDQPAEFRPVFALNEGGLLVPDGVKPMPVSPYTA